MIHSKLVDIFCHAEFRDLSIREAIDINRGRIKPANRQLSSCATVKVNGGTEDRTHCVCGKFPMGLVFRIIPRDRDSGFHGGSKDEEERKEGEPRYFWKARKLGSSTPIK